MGTDDRQLALAKYIRSLDALIEHLISGTAEAQLMRERAYDALAELNREQRQARARDRAGEPEPEEPRG